MLPKKAMYGGASNNLGCNIDAAEYITEIKSKFLERPVEPLGISFLLYNQVSLGNFLDA